MSRNLELPQPWLADALEQLDLRKDDRCLVLTCSTPAHVAAVSQAVGRSARITVVEPDPERAGLAAQSQHENLEVLEHDPSPEESLGTFDALLACPLTTRGWPTAMWTELLARNLRPGGRFVLDLPAENFCDPLTRCWSQVGGDAAALANIQGPAESEIASALRDRGLRSVATSVGTHLVTLDNCYVLGELLRSLGVPDPDRDSCEIALIESLKTHEEVDVVLHRTRVHGLR